MKSNQRTRGRAAPGLLWLWILLGLLLVTAAALALSWRPVSAPESAAVMPDEISVSQTAEKRTGGAFILDVREPQEWETVHIPDAVLIPLAQLPDRLSEIPKDQEVVVVCRSGNRSAQARDLLKEAGYTNVASMAGGMNDWQAQGLPVVNGP